MELTVSSVCLKCGIIAKSGKISCCGGGGSWFRNCGSTGNTNLDHTWHEGIQACKGHQSQSKIAIGQQLNAGQHNVFDSSNSDGKAEFKVVITYTNTSVTHSIVTPIRTPHSASTSYNDVTTNSKAIPPVLVVTSVMTTSSRAPMDHTSTSMLINTSTGTPTSTSIAPQGRETLLIITVHVVILLMINVVL